jgi:peroxiredoxin Q/BCP
MLREGEAAPAFSASDHSGRMVTLSNFAGRNLLLWFYPKADTPG